MTMEIPAIYAIAAGGIIFSFVLVKALYYLAPLKSIVSVLVSKYLIYPYFLGRSQFIGPWTRAGVLLHVVYLATNLFCLFFGAASDSHVGRRAGELSLVNITFLFLAPYLSLLADILGVSIRTCRKIHRSTAWMSVLLLTIHIVIAILINRTAFPARDVNNFYAIIVSYPLQHETVC